MKVRQLEALTPAMVEVARELAEHDLAAEFRPLSAGLRSEAADPSDRAGGLADQWIQDVRLLGAFDDAGVMIGAAAIGWRPENHAADDAEAVILWAHAREDREVLRPLLRFATVAAVDLAREAGLVVGSLSAFDSRAFEDGVSGVPTARRAVTQDVMAELGFSSSRDAMLLEGPARARLRLAETDKDATPAAPDGFQIERTEVEPRHIELRVLSDGGGLVAESAARLIGEHGGEITWLWTDPRWRNEGFGRLLVRWTLAWLDQAGATTVRVQLDADEVAGSDRARPSGLGLFSSVGFHVADELFSYSCGLARVDGTASTEWATASSQWATHSP